jgi:hypothetical protein
MGVVPPQVPPQIKAVLVRAPQRENLAKPLANCILALAEAGMVIRVVVTGVLV